MLRNRSAREFAVLAFAHILLGLLFLTTGYVRPDSVGAMAYLPSAALDRDLLFFNEWFRFGMISESVTWFKEVTALGTLANHWGIGSAVLAAPGYLVALLIGGWPEDGFSGLPGLVVAWTTVAMTCIGLWWTNETLRDQDRLTTPIRAVVLAATLLGTPLFWYTFRFPMGTHAAGALCLGAAAVLLRRGLTEHGFALGLLLGLAIIVRVQHVVLLPVILLAALTMRAPASFFARFIAGAAPPLLVQAIAWQVIYGTPVGPLLGGANLTGSTWTPFHNTNFVAVLFSSYHGLFLWSPVTLLAVAGWIIALRSDNRRTAAIFLAMFAAELAANAMFDRYFWGGLSFGQRRFTDLGVLFAFGLGWFCAAFRMAAVPLTILSTVWTTLLASAAISGPLSLSRYQSVAEMLRALRFASPNLSRIRPPILDPGLFAASLAAITIVAGLCLLLWRAREKWAAITTIYLLICAAGIAAMGPATRSRVESSLVRFSIDRAASERWGPLVDQRGLLLAEIEYLERTNRQAEARATKEEVARIDVMLKELRP